MAVSRLLLYPKQPLAKIDLGQTWACSGPDLDPDLGPDLGQIYALEKKDFPFYSVRKRRLDIYIV